MKAIKLPKLGETQTAFKLGGGESVVVDVRREPIEGNDREVRLVLVGWQAKADGSRFTDNDGNAVIIPVKTRVVDSDDENAEADAIAAVARRTEDHIEARKAMALRRASMPDPTEDLDRDSI